MVYEEEEYKVKCVDVIVGRVTRVVKPCDVKDESEGCAVATHNSQNNEMNQMKLNVTK